MPIRPSARRTICSGTSTATGWPPPNPRRPVDGRRVLPAAGRGGGGQPGDRRGSRGGSGRAAPGSRAADRRSLPQLHGHRDGAAASASTPIARPVGRGRRRSTDPRACSGRSAGCAGTGSAGRSCIDIDSDPADPDQYVLNLYQGGSGCPTSRTTASEQHADDPRGLRRHSCRRCSSWPASRTRQAQRGADHRAGDRARGRPLGPGPIPGQHHRPTTRRPGPSWTSCCPQSLGTPGCPASAPAGSARPGHRPAAGLLSRARPRLTSRPHRRTGRHWLTWQIVRSFAPLRPGRRWSSENFDFYGRTLSGQPAAARAVEARRGLRRDVPPARRSAELYVERHFPPAAKERMDELVANLLEAYRRYISTLAVDEPGDQGAGAGQARRLHAEDRLPRRVAGLLLARGRAPTTSPATPGAAAAFELDRQLAKIGTPVDRAEWLMSPQTVNAYYNPGMNEIVFPAAILQPPFFDPEADDAVNYGGIGAVIGHEIGHGFDDQGSQVRRHAARCTTGGPRPTGSASTRSPAADRPVQRPRAGQTRRSTRSTAR